MPGGRQYGKGGKNFLRINTVCPRKVLMDGLERLTEGLTAYESICSICHDKYRRGGDFMKKMLRFLLAGLFVICLIACGSDESSSAGSAAVTEETSDTEEDISGTESTAASVEDETSDEKSEEEKNMKQNTFYVIVEGTIFSAIFADNAGAQALQDLLAGGDVTIQMSDYAGFEKVGSLGQSLPFSDSQTTTQAGDIVLYQGNQIVIFYGSNSWSYTRLGKIDDLTGWEEALGGGDVSVTFSLKAGNQ